MDRVLMSLLIGVLIGNDKTRILINNQLQKFGGQIVDSVNQLNNSPIVKVSESEQE